LKLSGEKADDVSGEGRRGESCHVIWIYNYNRATVTTIETLHPVLLRKMVTLGHTEYITLAKKDAGDFDIHRMNRNTLRGRQDVKNIHN
jgi:hypothetical protein